MSDPIYILIYPIDVSEKYQYRYAYTYKDVVDLLKYMKDKLESHVYSRVRVFKLDKEIPTTNFLL